VIGHRLSNRGEVTPVCVDSPTIVLYCSVPRHLEPTFLTVANPPDTQPLINLEKVMKFSFDQGRLLFTEAEPITFEFSSQGTGHRVNYQLLNHLGVVLEDQTLLSENESVGFHFDPSAHGKRSVIIDVDFSLPHGGKYDVKVLSGTDRSEIALFQIRQHDNKNRVLIDLEGDPIVLPPKK
jgi:hypothetical protein